MTPELEERMRVAQDTRKHFTFHKSRCRWFWCDRNDIERWPDAYTGPFKTFWEALVDATAPYVEE